MIKVKTGVVVSNIGQALSLSLENKRGRLSPSSFRSDSQKTNALIEWIGHADFSEMTQSDWNSFIGQLQAKYAPSTVNQYLTLLRRATQTALADRVISDDPLKLHKTMYRGEVEKHPFTENEIRSLLYASHDYPFEVALIKLGLSTGMRICELMSVSAECYDAEAMTCRIDQSLVNGEFKSPKNDGSQRVIELTRPAVEALETLISLSLGYDKEDYKFLNQERRVQIRSRKLLARCSATGKRYKSVDEFRNKFFMGYCRLVGVPFRGPKNFRHTFASQMLSANAPIKWILDTLGHSDYGTLKKHYGVWINEQDSRPKTQAIEHLSRILNPLAGVVESAPKQEIIESTVASNDDAKFSLNVRFFRRVLDRFIFNKKVS